ncbi:AAA+ family ATPase [Rhodobacter lacus]|uniref:AAA+ family ATPase n=1 Tax=Rhodobacter lacus TaxID=1641972 RepID=A0ABW5A3X2_9RHOB
MDQRILLAATIAAALGGGGYLAYTPAQESAPPAAPERLAPPERDPEVAEPSGRDDMVAGRTLLERGAELFLRGLMDELGPQIDEMQEGLGAAAEKLGPKLTQLLALIDDVRNYQAPERLENGDIVIRRMPGAPPPPPLPEGRKTAPAPPLSAPVTDL